MPGFEILAGGTLDQVAFEVDGTVQCWIDVYPLRAAAPVIVAHGTARLAPGDLGWRDALCALLGQRVGAAHDLGERLRLEFPDAVVEILVAEAPPGADFAAHIDDANGGEIIWPASAREAGT